MESLDPSPEQEVKRETERDKVRYSLTKAVSGVVNRRECWPKAPS